MQARLALLLGKTYIQEQPLRWGYLTPPAEESRHGRVKLEGPRRDPPPPSLPPSPSPPPPSPG